MTIKCYLGSEAFVRPFQLTDWERKDVMNRIFHQKGARRSLTHKFT